MRQITETTLKRWYIDVGMDMDWIARYYDISKWTKYDLSGDGDKWNYDIWVPCAGGRNGKEIYLFMKQMVREHKLNKVI